MFRGAIPAELRAIIDQYVESWDCEKVYVGCSGNFTIERLLTAHNKKIYSNDVQLYSSVLGCYFSRQPFELTIREEYQDKLEWLKEYIDTQERAAATVMLSTRMPAQLDQPNAYYQRIMRGFRSQWSRLHSETVEKLNRVNLNLESYYLGDVVDYEASAPKGEGLIVFPPFYSGDYEAQFKSLDKIFQWEEPDYQLFDDQRRLELLNEVALHKHWIIGLHLRIKEFEPYLRAILQTTNRGVRIYVYTDNKEVRCVMPAQEVAAVPWPRLLPGMEIGNKITLHVLTEAQFCSLRSQYMNPGIKPGKPSLALAVVVDGILIGAFAYSIAPSFASIPQSMPQPHGYLLSDFPVAPSDYKRLSKLVLYAALSKEGQILIERTANHRIRTITTTAYTNKPVSMKYRSLFKLLSRKKQDGQMEGTSISDQYYAKKYALQYGSVIGKWSLVEALDIWKQKHAPKK